MRSINPTGNKKKLVEELETMKDKIINFIKQQLELLGL
jgi:hypothetical protein